VVGGLGAALEDAEGFAGVEGGFGDDGEQHGFAHVVGAGAGDEDAAGGEQFEGAEVDFLVAAGGGVEAGAGFGEGGRVEDDGRERLVAVLFGGEEVEDVGFAEVDVGEAVEGGVGAGAGDGGGGGVDGGDRVAAGGEVEGESAGGSEAIEGAAGAGVAGGGEVVVALVEVDAGLLAFEQVGIEGESVHADADGAVDGAVQDAFFLGQGFTVADGDIVAEDDGAGGEEFVERGEEVGLGAVHALVEGLEDERVMVAVDDEAGEQVGFGEDDAVGVGVVDDVAAVEEGGFEAASEEGGADGFGLIGEQAQRDLGRGAVVGGAEDAAGGSGDEDGIAGGGGAAVEDIACEDPGVAGGDAGGAFFGDPDGGGYRMASRRAIRCSVAGWVANRFIRDRPVNGLMMNR
jgi:hypothetical protein